MIIAWLCIVAVAVTRCYLALLAPGGVLQKFGKKVRDKVLSVEMDEDGYTDRHTIYKAIGGCDDCVAFWIGCVMGIVGLIVAGWPALGIPFVVFYINSILP